MYPECIKKLHMFITAKKARIVLPANLLVSVYMPLIPLQRWVHAATSQNAEDIFVFFIQLTSQLVPSRFFHSYGHVK